MAVVVVLVVTVVVVVVGHCDGGGVKKDGEMMGGHRQVPGVVGGGSGSGVGGGCASGDGFEKYVIFFLIFCFLFWSPSLAPACEGRNCCPFAVLLSSALTLIERRSTTLPGFNSCVVLLIPMSSKPALPRL